MQYRKMQLAVVAAAMLVLGMGVAAADPGVPPSLPTGPPVTSIPQSPQTNVNDYPHGATPKAVGKYMPDMTEARLKAKLAKLGMPYVPHPEQNTFTTMASGALPYGGSQWSGFSEASEGGDDLVHGCSWGVSTQSSDGRLFGSTAGHCFKSEDGTRNLISPTIGRFWYPYTTNVRNIPPNLSNAGHAGARFDSCCDRGAIRVNLKAPLYSEVGTFDSRGAVRVFGPALPSVGMDVSQSGGTSRRLIHGVVTNAGTCLHYLGNPACIGNQFVIQMSDGCTQPGDSGGSIVDSLHNFVGTTTGGWTEGSTCFIGADRSQSSFAAMALRLAPAPPA
jgi:hypothetical protein